MLFPQGRGGARKNRVPNPSPWMATAALALSLMLLSSNQSRTGLASAGPTRQHHGPPALSARGASQTLYAEETSRPRISRSASGLTVTGRAIPIHPSIGHESDLSAPPNKTAPHESSLIDGIRSLVRKAKRFIDRSFRQYMKEKFVRDAVLEKTGSLRRKRF